MRIFKFGGASVKDAEGVNNLIGIVQSHLTDSLVIVVSAMGKTTNGLEELVRLSLAGTSWEEELHHINVYHDQICMELFGEVPDELELLQLQLRKTLEAPIRMERNPYYDTIVPFGELMSTVIVHRALQRKGINATWVDARKFVKTNSIYTEANVDWQLTEHFISRDIPTMLENGPVITQGFIGSDLTGKTTTLGREGSDYTGAIFAYALKAESLTVWKDVPGLLNADPKVFPQAELFDELSFQEVTELTYYGAKVIHPKTIKPLAQRNIPLYVRSFLHPEGPGTRISASEGGTRKATFVFKENQLLFTLRVKDNSFMDEKKLGKIFQTLDHVNAKVNMMHSSALTFTFCMDYAAHKLQGIKDYLQNDFQVLYNDGLHLATIKNYDEQALSQLPCYGEMILEQKTRNTYQVLYRP